MRAEVYRDAADPQPAATGHAYELKSEGYVNRTSHVENAETSAVGRALAMLGLEVKRGIASQEDHGKAQRYPRPAPPAKPPADQGEAPVVRRLRDNAYAVKAGGIEFEVGKTKSGLWQCYCPDYDAHKAQTPAYVCAHKAALKKHLETSARLDAQAAAEAPPQT